MIPEVDHSWNFGYCQDMLSLEMMLKMIDDLSTRLFIRHADDICGVRDAIVDLFHTVENELIEEES